MWRLLDSKQHRLGRQEKSSFADDDWGKGVQASQDLVSPEKLEDKAHNELVAAMH